MTWGSFLSRSLSLIIVLPLILTRLSTEEISLWYLFSTVIGLQRLVDLGFSPTFSRVIAFGMGGLNTSELKDVNNPKQYSSSNAPNWETIEKIFSTMKAVYLRLTGISILLLISLGTLALIKPISAVPNTFSAWTAWGVILIVSTATIIGNVYNAYLQGVNQIALLRRWEMLFSLGAIGTSFIVLLFDGGLLELVVANQIWLLLNILRNRWLCKIINNKKFSNFEFQYQDIDPLVFEAVWSSAWRSGLGSFMNYGLVQISGIIYAQFGSASVVASYLLSLRFIQVVNQFAQAPFYSKLPTLAKLYSSGKLKQQVMIAHRGMKIAYWSFIFGFISIGIFASPILDLIDSNAKFANPLLWSLMGLGVFAERYGAMHMHFYSITNHIIWHIANGYTGVIYLLVSLILFNKIGIYAFPLGTLVSNLGFYCWYSAMHSYKAFNLKFWKFERSAMIIPLTLILMYCLGSVMYFIFKMEFSIFL